MGQKRHLATGGLNGRFTVTGLCTEFGVLRRTAHRWLAIYHLFGAAVLVKGSRAP